MDRHEKKMAALAELKAMRLSPTDTLNVQILLGMQEFMRAIDMNMVNTPFVEWTLVDMCRALKVEVSA